MKKNIIIALSVIVLCTSCYSNGAMLGASIGSLVGGMAGDMTDTRHGYQMGAIMGTLAGAAAGSAIEAGTRQKQSQTNTQTSRRSQQTTVSYATRQSDLSVENVMFFDENNNQAIDAKESCRVTFDIINNGSQTVYNFTPMLDLLSESKGINLGKTSTVESIKSGSKITYSVPVVATSSLKNGEAVFQAYVVEQDGATSEAQQFALSTIK